MPTKGPTLGRKRRSKDEAVAAAELRSTKRQRVISITDFSALTGYDRGTVSRWIDRGCPIEGKGDKGAILLDVRAVIEWKEEQARSEERRRAPAEADDDYDDEDREIKRQTIKAMKIKMAKDVGVLVPAAVVLMSQASTLNAFRTAAESLPGRIEREVLNGFDKIVVRAASSEIKDHVHAMLRSAKASMDRDFLRMTKDRLAELGIEPDDDFDVEQDDEDEDGLIDEVDDGLI